MLGCVIHGQDDLRVAELPVPRPGPGQALVAVRYGGVCGSDLHYWRHGGVGDFRLREPMVLGHEVVGTVVEYGADASGPAPGSAVAVHPATPCGVCPECAAGRRNVCRDTRYLGSAARFPHVQGGFAAQVVVPAEQVRALPDGLELRRAALAEPLSVALHAVRRAGGVAERFARWNDGAGDAHRATPGRTAARHARGDHLRGLVRRQHDGGTHLGDAHGCTRVFFDDSGVAA